MALRALRKFIHLESSAGVLLVLATVFALLISNSPLRPFYDSVLQTEISVAVGRFGIAKPVLLWINDGLMAIFFVLIGLEVKREVLDGELASKEQLLLPAVAALGGFVLPALIYLWFNGDNPGAINGWAIPAATDIAFALGILMLLGSRVPLALKVFLTSIAIFDDIAAIIVIAAFYTSDLSLLSLALGGSSILVLIVLNRSGVARIAPYVLTGIVTWVFVLKSGVHATLAGFLLGLSIPLATSDAADASDSPLRRLESALHPWVAFAIMPVFAFANAGISFASIGVDLLLSPVVIGIVAGLFVGKQLGIFACIWLLVRLGIARLPRNTTWVSLYGVSILAGIGFTMSLFIGTLAFENGNFDHADATRLGVLVGSLLSALLGYVVLRICLQPPASENEALAVASLAADRNQAITGNELRKHSCGI